MQHELQARIVDILARCVDMTIATVRPDGAPQATVVSFAHDGLTLYFYSSDKGQAELWSATRRSLSSAWENVQWLPVARLGVGAATDALKSIWPFYIASFVVLLIVAYIPQLSLWLPALLK